MLEHSLARKEVLNWAWIKLESDNQKTMLHKISTITFPAEKYLKGIYNLPFPKLPQIQLHENFLIMWSRQKARNLTPPLQVLF